jgi:uncharacterized C2H2 Zn-finger protein
MSAHQCPRCELMFSFRTEVDYHVASDHRLPTPRPRTTNEGDAKNTELQENEPDGATASVST